MPSYSNVNAPLNIFGAGRSGTTLLQALLCSSGWIQNCNETLGLVLGTWSGSKFSSLSSDKEVLAITSDQIAIGAVQGALVGALQSSKGGWTQKLAGLPNNFVWEPYITNEDVLLFSDLYAFPAKFYWNCLERCFPNAINILIVRNPLEIALSRIDYSKWRRDDVLMDLAVLYRAYEMNAHYFHLVVSYERLRERSEDYVRNMFERLGLQFAIDSMTVFDHRFVGGSDDRQRLNTDEAALEYIGSNSFSSSEVKALRSISISYSKLGVPGEFPNYLKSFA